MFKIFKKILGTANDRIIKKLYKDAQKINEYESLLEELSDQDLKAKTINFKNQLKEGQSLDDIVYEAFAVVREASKRVLKMRHFDVQLIGGLILHQGNITEMRTGEGKTLVATLPAYLNALEGKGVHVVTVNDYLAKRDAQWMRKLYEFLGVSVDCIIAGMSDERKKQAYNSDIIYATNNEIGFDYLRDNMKFSKQERVLPEFNYAIVDEVDSILIDEARTPLIISGPADDSSDLYISIDKIVSKLESDDFEKEEKTKTINLTESGINKVENIMVSSGLIKEGTSLFDFENMKLVHYINQSLKARHLFSKDVDYLVSDGKILIIDEFTGRVMEGRRYSDGLHQAIEAKEGVEVQNENQTLASITFQNFFRMYKKLSGMTGTAMTEADELKDIYNIDVVSVPTNKPSSRIDEDDAIYGSKQEKYDAILELVRDCYQRGQPILVGTISIEKSEEISNLFKENNITHNILNAKNHEKEAHIIAQAGRFKSVTIATNMAGRGTDIQLGGNPEMLIELEVKNSMTDEQIKAKEQEIYQQVEEEKQKVIEAGGLYVIGTERHESRRIDNQLRGRCGRQGDPGKTKFFLSLEDDLMRIFASDRISGVLRNLGLKGGEAIHHPMISRSLEKAQQKVEAHNYEIRKNLLKFDDVMNDQRKVIYEQRDDIMDAENLVPTLEAFSKQLLDNLVIKFIPPESFREMWDLEGLDNEIERIYGITCKVIDYKDKDTTEEEISKDLYDKLYNYLKNKEEYYGSKIFNQAIKYIFITTLDQIWKDHLYTLDHLRQGISLRAYGQKDPLNEYKREAFSLFDKMLDSFTEQTVSSCYQFQLNINKTNLDELTSKHKSDQQTYESREDPAFSKYNSEGTSLEVTPKPYVAHVPKEDRKKDDPSTWGKVSRNEYCPCGSGKKYKHCHGRLK